jgi:hypothetical protein
VWRISAPSFFQSTKHRNKSSLFQKLTRNAMRDPDITRALVTLLEQAETTARATGVSAPPVVVTRIAAMKVMVSKPAPNED